VRQLLKWALTACVVFTVISMAATGCASADDAARDNTQADVVATSEAEAEEAEAEAEADAEASDETAGQDNARRSAENYLDTAAFSRKGLIKQLEFEGYSTADATYAVDAVNADWNEQAARSAKSYLETSPFSRSGLIQQLEFEGFTHGQAVYGVNEAGL
jgi:colicin import membrane protein